MPLVHSTSTAASNSSPGEEPPLISTVVYRLRLWAMLHDDQKSETSDVGGGGPTIMTPMTWPVPVRFAGTL